MSAAIDTERRGQIRTPEEAVSAAVTYAESLAPRVIDRDRAGKVPVAELKALDASGLLSITVPRAYGGPGLGASVLAEVIKTIAAVDPAIAQVPQAHFLYTDVLTVWGSPAQQATLFGAVLSGERFGNGMAERGGQHAQDLATRLEPDASGSLRLTGRKYYCTGAISAAWIGVTALDPTGSLVLAFVPRDAPGVTAGSDWNVMGQRATVSGSVTFSDVLVDPALVVPYARAFEVPQQLGARAQLFHTAIQTGIAVGALRDARWFVRDKARPFFEASRAGLAPNAGADPHTLGAFGELATKVRAAEALLAWAASELDAVGLVPSSAASATRGSLAVAQAKAFASETAVAVASDLFGLTGASAADEKYGLSRHWRNARTHASHDPVTWKYHHIGNYLLNDVSPPNHGQI
jgi:SfnB family sulfur acquisition oxidoreductase